MIPETIRTGVEEGATEYKGVILPKGMTPECLDQLACAIILLVSATTSAVCCAGGMSTKFVTVLVS